MAFTIGAREGTQTLNGRIILNGGAVGFAPPLFKIAPVLTGQHAATNIFNIFNILICLVFPSPRTFLAGDEF